MGPGKALEVIILRRASALFFGEVLTLYSLMINSALQETGMFRIHHRGTVKP